MLLPKTAMAARRRLLQTESQVLKQTKNLERMDNFSKTIWNSRTSQKPKDRK